MKSIFLAAFLLAGISGASSAQTMEVLKSTGATWAVSVASHTYSLMISTPQGNWDWLRITNESGYFTRGIFCDYSIAVSTHGAARGSKINGGQTPYDFKAFPVMQGKQFYCRGDPRDAVTIPALIEGFN